MSISFSQLNTPEIKASGCLTLRVDGWQHGQTEACSVKFVQNSFCVSNCRLVVVFLSDFDSMKPEAKSSCEKCRLSLRQSNIECISPNPPLSDAKRLFNTRQSFFLTPRH